MKFLVLCLLVLAVAVAISLLTQGDSGYVLIARDTWTMEMSLWLFLVGLLVVFVLGYIVFRLIGGIFRTPRKVGNWQKQRALVSASKQIQKGYIELIEGNWGSAEKRLLSKLGNSPAPVLNYLAAAYAAQQRGDTEKRDYYLGAAYENQPEHHAAIRLTQARMQAQAGQYEQALATIAKLRAHSGRNPQISRLELNIYRSLGDWAGLLDTVPRLRKQPDVDSEELEQIEIEASRNMLEAAMLDGTSPVKAWENFSPNLRKNVNLIETYANKLIALEHHEAAEQILRQSIKRSWDTDLAGLYGRASSQNKEKQLMQAEKWLKDHPTDHGLLLSLGRLAIRSEQWGKARSYLETSIAEGGGKQALMELGNLLEQLGESDKALEAYRSGLQNSLPPSIRVDSSRMLVQKSEESAA